jgi:hypothetical protein
MNIVKLGIQEDIDEEKADETDSSQRAPITDEERKRGKLQALDRLMKLMKQLRYVSPSVPNIRR